MHTTAMELLEASRRWVRVSVWDLERVSILAGEHLLPDISGWTTMEQADGTPMEVPEVGDCFVLRGWSWDDEEEDLEEWMRGPETARVHVRVKYACFEQGDWGPLILELELR